MEVTTTTSTTTTTTSIQSNSSSSGHPRGRLSDAAYDAMTVEALHAALQVPPQSEGDFAQQFCLTHQLSNTPNTEEDQQAAVRLRSILASKQQQQQSSPQLPQETTLPLLGQEKSGPETPVQAITPPIASSEEAEEELKCETLPQGTQRSGVEFLEDTELPPVVKCDTFVDEKDSSNTNHNHDHSENLPGYVPTTFASGAPPTSENDTLDPSESPDCESEVTTTAADAVASTWVETVEAFALDPAFDYDHIPHLTPKPRTPWG